MARRRRDDRADLNEYLEWLQGGGHDNLLETLRETIKRYSSAKEDSDQMGIRRDGKGKVAEIGGPVRPPIARSSAEEDLLEKWKERIVGQDQFIERVEPYLVMHSAGLSAEDRPVGAWLLAGPTGTGKTRSVEALAEVLHGSKKSLLRVDCAEFQMEHEVAKLIGAPPGYLGHRETQPVFTQQKLNSLTSEKCPLAIILLDEIEKAAPSITRLLLGALDKGEMRMGDNSICNFARTLIFMTSNLGAAEMEQAAKGFGLGRGQVEVGNIDSVTIADGAIKRKFSPEFRNRLSGVIHYRTLTEEEMRAITKLELDIVQQAIARKGTLLRYTSEVVGWLLEKGYSTQYGARELRRTIEREISVPVARLITSKAVERFGQVVDAEVENGTLSFAVVDTLAVEGDEDSKSRKRAAA